MPANHGAPFLRIAREVLFESLDRAGHARPSSMCDACGICTDRCGDHRMRVVESNSS
jgi:Pyruvate/2-oxoacid:ferredoxin oxidoreductase delta subunit